MAVLDSCILRSWQQCAGSKFRPPPARAWFDPLFFEVDYDESCYQQQHCFAPFPFFFYTLNSWFRLDWGAYINDNTAGIYLLAQLMSRPCSLPPMLWSTLHNAAFWSDRVHWQFDNPSFVLPYNFWSKCLQYTQRTHTYLDISDYKSESNKAWNIVKTIYFLHVSMH